MVLLHLLARAVTLVGDFTCGTEGKRGGDFSEKPVGFEVIGCS